MVLPGTAWFIKKNRIYSCRVICSEGLRTYCSDREKTQIQQAQIHLHNELVRIAIFAWICARNDEVNSFKRIMHTIISKQSVYRHTKTRRNQKDENN